MANTPTLAALMQEIVPLAQKHGITTLMLVGRDPRTGELGLFSDQNSMEQLREFTEQKLLEKLGMVGETSWNDV